MSVIDAFQKHQGGEISDDEFAKVLGIVVPSASEGGMAGVSKLKKWFTRTYLGY